MTINTMIYRSEIEFTDGRKFDDIWIDEEHMMSYIESAPHFDNIKRAEAYIMTCEPDSVMYSVDKYLYEYDIDGHYYYNVA